MRQNSVDQLSQTLRAIVGRDGVLSEPDELLVYECDGLPQHKYRPRAVVFPRSTEEVAEVLKVLARERVPFAPRGAGTGLSGGALALDTGVVIELARMRRLLKIDPENRLAVVETGLVNAHLSRAAAPFGLHYVPDPSSQMTCTIGGNLAENSGGIHCLKYGTTVDHVLAARVVLGGGEIVDLDLKTPGYDLLGVFIGSEGTFGIATEATLRLSPIPPAVRTLLAIFDDVDDASRAVSAIIAEGLVPAGLEMMDGAIIRAVEASVFAAGLPTDAEAALLIELDGLEAGLDTDVARAEKICLDNRARQVQRAADEDERKRLWAARKGAFGAMGRISPDTMLQDAVVPRSRLPEVLAVTYRIGAKYGLRVANVFHAGDGNLHPFLCFDARRAEEVRSVKEAGRELMETCVRAGGSITGEHGVGLDKSDYLPLIFNTDEMETMLRVRAAFDPTGLCNPGKIIPTSRSCGEARRTMKSQAEGERRKDEISASPLRTGKDVEAQTTDNQRAWLTPASSSSFSTSSPATQAGRRASGIAPQKLLVGIVGEENVCEAVLDQSLEAAPASVEEAGEILRLATSEGWSVMPAGAGTWLNVGNPLQQPDVIISMRRMARIIEHEPADLIATAEAGVQFTSLNEELAHMGQWLPLDPPDDGRATLGGVAATGQAGAQSFGYGAPRSFVIGMRVMLADGRIIRAGGRVVKNVAGYDLCKLFTGSCGTLGLILEITFKLRPLPEQTTSLAFSGPPGSLLLAARSLLDDKLLPVALELLSTRAARNIGLSKIDTDCILLVRLAGTSQAVAYQSARAQSLLKQGMQIKTAELFDDDAGLWRHLAALPLSHEHQLIWRALVPPTALGPFLERMGQDEGQAFSSSSWQAGAGDGRVCLMTAVKDTQACLAALADLSERARAAGGALVIESATEEIRSKPEVWGRTDTSTKLMRRIKKQLDPENILSAGRFASVL